MKHQDKVGETFSGTPWLKEWVNCSLSHDKSWISHPDLRYTLYWDNCLPGVTTDWGLWLTGRLGLLLSLLCFALLVFSSHSSIRDSICICKVNIIFIIWNRICLSWHDLFYKGWSNGCSEIELSQYCTALSKQLSSLPDQYFWDCYQRNINFAGLLQGRDNSRTQPFGQVKLGTTLDVFMSIICNTYGGCIDLLIVTDQCNITHRLRICPFSVWVHLNSTSALSLHSLNRLTTLTYR